MLVRITNREDPDQTASFICQFFFLSNSVHFVARYLTLLAFCLFSEIGVTSDGAYFLLYIFF